MKKTFQLVALFSVLSGSAFSQNFIQITQSDFQRQVKVSQNQAVEIRLPTTPSTGFGWYPASNNENVIRQVGNWEFISDNPTSIDVGGSGTQINHYVTVAAGTTDLELLYKRPWEDASQATASYKVTIVSQGAYTGTEVKPYVPAADKSAALEKNESTLALPAAFSWQALNMCTTVKDQKQCGSCWSFASSGAFECVVKIWDNVTRDMAEQWLVNCDKTSSGCGGGSLSAMKMFVSKGSVYEADEPYKAANGTCKSTYTYHEKAISAGTVSNSTTAIKQALYDYGPMYVSIDAGNNFQNYKSGIMTQSDGTSNNHAVLLCGWDDNGGTNSYWIIRNSWGTSWGESGYFRIKYGVSGVGQDVGYVNYKGIINHNPTGIPDLNVNSSVQVFPNPSNGVFTFSNLENENRIEVYDYVGNLIYQTTSKNTSVAVDLKEKSQGIYMYKVINTSTKGVKAGKLIVY